MKKIYISAVVAIATLTFNITNAQVIFNENFDDYSTGDLIGQSPNFELWPGSTSSQVTSAEANSMPHSLLTRNNTTDDIVMLLGNVTGGQYTLQFDVYVPSGSTGFFGFMQTDNTAAPEFSTTFYPNLNSTNQNVIAQGPNVVASFDMLFDFWNTFKFEIDLDGDTFDFYIDESLAYSGPFNSTGNLGAVNIWSVDEDNTMYLDNIIFAEGVLSTNDFEGQAFQVYPNPVQNQLNIQSKEAVNSVSIYNVLGKLVHQSSPNTISPSIDMAAYKSGIYFVEVTIGNATRTVKVVK